MEKSDKQIAKRTAEEGIDYGAEMDVLASHDKDHNKESDIVCIHRRAEALEMKYGLDALHKHRDRVTAERRNDVSRAADAGNGCADKDHKAAHSNVPECPGSV